MLCYAAPVLLHVHDILSSYTTASERDCGGVFLFIKTKRKGKKRVKATLARWGMLQRLLKAKQENEIIIQPGREGNKL